MAQWEDLAERDNFYYKIQSYIKYIFIIALPILFFKFIYKNLGKVGKIIANVIFAIGTVILAHVIIGLRAMGGTSKRII